jgi:hypothetical protein
MNRTRIALIGAGLLTAFPALAKTAGNTANTGPQGTGNFVAGKAAGDRQSGLWPVRRNHE